MNYFLIDIDTFFLLTSDSMINYFSVTIPAF